MLEKSLEKRLKDKLQELKLSGQTLKVTWDAGGDETPVRFYIDDSVSLYGEKLFDKLRWFLIQKFALPNAGEYYNEGQAEIYLREGEVYIKYREYAYFLEGNEIEFENFPAYLDIKDTLGVERLLMSRSLLKKLQSLPIEVYVSFKQEKESELDIYGMKEWTPQHEALLDYLEKQILDSIEIPTEHAEINFFGKLSKQRIDVERIFGYRYRVDKDNRQIEVRLFG